MTVDELGRSLIILLPSCPDETLNEDECPVGAITVSNAAGSVSLNEAYQGTMVSSMAMLPSDPRRLLLQRSNINNELIIVPPSEFPNGFATEDEEEEIRTGLDVDFLEYQELSVNLLNDDLLNFSQLDVNRLNNKYLDNFLDFTPGLDDNELDEEENTILPNIHKYPWMTWIANEESIFIDSDRPPHIAVLNTRADTHGTYSLTQDDYVANVQIQDGGDNINIKVVQKQ
jgi:hypothetical protein